MQKELRQVARKARRWLVGYIRRKRRLLNSRDIGPFDVCGFCAIGAAKVYTLLKSDKRFSSVEINPVAVESLTEGSHAYIVVSTKDDDIIVDITADQFGMKPIEIRSAHDKENDWFWGNDDDESLSLSIGIESFKKSVEEWDSTQNPVTQGILKGV